MITYHKHILSNGLRLLVIEDHTTPLVSVNTLYNVGARDEDPQRTGFAHLFEHLMFGGTHNVPDYDIMVNRMGGESNAFTNNDFTNYYITVPVRFLETALWLESDRMRQLDFSQHSLQVQQSVVTEEYNYRYMNQPYGDVWMLLRPLCYKVHPYRWCTIGADIRHVQEATLNDVESFFYRYYRPNNAILAIAGPVKDADVVSLVEKWFADIPSGESVRRGIPEEPLQNGERRLSVERDVPSDALYVGYHMCGRFDDDFRTTDLISDILSNGTSARLYNQLVKEQSLFTEIDAYITGDCDPGLFVVSGKLRKGVGFDQALDAVDESLMQLSKQPMPATELEKVLNKYEAHFVFSQYKALDCAMSLCYYEWLGHSEWVNEEPSLYRHTTTDDIRRVSESLFQHNNRSVLLYSK